MAVTLFDRVLVDSAPRRVRAWGYWQFPSLYQKDGKFYFHFHDAEDHYSSYGAPGWVYESGASHISWSWCRDEEAYQEACSLRLPNGDLIRRYSANTAMTAHLKLPAPAGEFEINHRHYTCYRNDELPPELGGLSLLRRKAGKNEWKPEHADMHEKGGIRCAFDGYLPAMQVRCNRMWLGADLKPYLLVYNFKLDENGRPGARDAVYLLRSDDGARSFHEIGTIPYEPDEAHDRGGFSSGRRGFLEPDICFLDERRALCVMRTTHHEIGPLYLCRSEDGGRTWSKPRVIHDHGVYPRLVRLACGALVLSFGRPGVDIMVSWDDGRTWGKPICIVPQKHSDISEDTCGYTGLIPAGEDTCMIGFSDFYYDPGDGYPRKALFSQLIQLTKEEKPDA